MDICSQFPWLGPLSPLFTLCPLQVFSCVTGLWFVWWVVLSVFLAGGTLCILCTLLNPPEA